MSFRSAAYSNDVRFSRNEPIVYPRSVQVHDRRKKKMIEASSCAKFIKSSGPRSPPSPRFEATPFDVAGRSRRFWNSGRGTGKSENFTYVIDLRLSRGPRKIFGEVHGTHMQALPVAYSRAQVHHRHRGDRRRWCAREKTRALPSFPALTCRPFFFVPPAYRARFFKATHVLSMCDMLLKRHEAEGDMREYAACAYLRSAGAIY